MPKHVGRIIFLCVTAAILLLAQDWTTATSLPGVDLSGLTAVQKATVMKVLREHGCSCGCEMKVAECRIKDPSCTYSRGLASVVADAVRHGKNAADAWAAASASQYAHGPASHTKLLEDPVAISLANAPVRGPAGAPVTLVEFSDFQCPFCVAATPQLDALLKAYPSQVKLIFKQFPLDSHSQAALAAAAALAAHKQGKFWPLHDAMFAQKGNLSRQGILELAARAGLNMPRFQADLDSADVKREVARDIADGEKIGVDATPTLFIDGQRYNGPITIEKLKPILAAEAKHPARLGAVTRASR